MLLALLLACTGPAEPEPLHIVALSEPVGWIAQTLTGDDARVEVFPADPSAKQIASLREADLVLANGLGWEPWAEGANLSAHNLLFVTKDQRILSRGGVEDPRIWMDPMAVVEQAKLVYTELNRMRPGNPTWKVRRNKIVTDLQAIDSRMRLAFRPLRDNPTAVGSDHFRYLARRYGLDLVEFKLPSDTVAPEEAERLVSWIDGRTAYVFLDRPVSPEVRAQLPNSTDVVPLYNLAGGEHYNYLSQLEANLAALEMRSKRASR